MHRGDDRTGVRIQQIDLSQIPARPGQPQSIQVRKASRHLEATPGQTQRAVAASLTTNAALTERLSQTACIGRGALNRWRVEKTPQGRAGHLAVHVLLIVALDPDLSQSVQLVQRETRHRLEHGHQAPFDVAPEGFLFAILRRRIR